MSDLVTDLSHNALLSVSGDDAAAFLQAQLTNDVAALAPGTAQWNGWCSAKGRLLATFLLARRADGFLIILPAEIAAPIAKRLAMFVLRSKVKIADVSAQYALRGILGQRAEPQPMRVLESDGQIVIGLEPGRFIALMPPGSATPANATRDAWELASVRAGVPIITAATQEAFVPQMANFELVGGVSFKKGCYPGQEIVARTQYRGILKKRMALAHVGGTDRPLPGDSVYSSAFGEQSAGTIVNAAPASGGGFDALVVAQLESLALNDLRWKSPGGPAVEILEHPPARQGFVKNEGRVPVAALVALIVIWGYSWVVMKIGLRYAHPFDFAALRVGLGAAFLFLIVAAQRRPLALSRYRMAIVLGLLQVALFVSLSQFALMFAEPGRTSVLVFTMPFWMIVFAHFLIGERMRGAQWLAVALAFAGLVLIVAPWRLTSLVGSLLAIAAGAVWALAAVLSKRWPTPGADPLPFTAWQLLVGFFPLTLLAFLHPHAPVNWTAEFVVALVFSALVATAIGWWLWIYVLSRTPAGIAGLNSLGIPVVAVTASAIQLGERPPALELAGMGLIGVALALLAWLNVRRNTGAVVAATPCD